MIGKICKYFWWFIGDTYEIKNIPQDEYYLKIAYGKDIRKKIVDDMCYIKFMSNAKYEKGSEILKFKLIKQPDKTIGNAMSSMAIEK